MWTTRWANAAMSCSCVTRTMVLPSACNSIEESHDFVPVFESRLPVGSSARMIEGLFTSARAIATRCRCPPESSFGLCSHARRPCLRRLASAGRAPAALPRECRIDQRQLHVVQGGSPRQQVEGLEDKADLPVADAGQLVVVQFADQLAVQPVQPLVGVSRQPIRFISVDFPEPEGPMIATYSLRLMRDSRRSARRPAARCPCRRSSTGPAYR